mmetsp:Transcript_19763/g.29345  ORF Transcript_19763/g.29345 Transcript_19763/m.29345 type:complete len:106 (+) Transcript_19763:1109-1426(+)
MLFLERMLSSKPKGLVFWPSWVWISLVVDHRGSLVMFLCVPTTPFLITSMRLLDLQSQREMLERRSVKSISIHVKYRLIKEFKLSDKKIIYLQPISYSFRGLSSR